MKLRSVLAPNQILIGVGYSLGGIILSNYVASVSSLLPPDNDGKTNDDDDKNSDKNGCPLDGAISISGALDYRIQKYNLRSKRLWQPMLTAASKRKFLFGKFGQRLHYKLSSNQLTKVMRATEFTVRFFLIHYYYLFIFVFGLLFLFIDVIVVVFLITFPFVASFLPITG